MVQLGGRFKREIDKDDKNYDKVIQGGRELQNASTGVNICPEKL